MSYEDVTARVAAAANRASTLQAALEARRSEIATITKESQDRTGLRSDVVTLYQGAQYWLYRYKKYTDVRLVFAPEQQMAFYGGDPDNFTFPATTSTSPSSGSMRTARRPLRQLLKWNAKGAADNELVFVSGHPGSTDRNDTLAELETERDVVYPINIQVVKRRLGVLRQFASRGPEQARQAAEITFSLENAQKAFTGEYTGLLDQKVMAKKATEERALQAPSRRTASGR
jgi:hypothetical protein